jgi:hypothetical protein
VILRGVTVGEGKISFRVDSNGCTDAASFEIRARRRQALTPHAAWYEIAIERVRIDECKAMLWDGVLIEIDLEKDLGLTGPCAVSVSNPILPKGGGGGGGSGP